MTGIGIANRTWFRLWAVLCIPQAAACHAAATYAPRPATDSATDAAGVDGAATDSQPVDGLQPSDGRVSDGRVDQGPTTPDPCPSQADSETEALYLFGGSGTVLDDQTGFANGQLEGRVTRVAGPPCGGGALSFPKQSAAPCKSCLFGISEQCPAEDAYAKLPDGVGRRASGAVDFWFRLNPDAPPEVGLLSRDANGEQQGGHLTIGVYNGIVYARMQSTTASFLRCSTPVTSGSWHHLGVNWGNKLELFVDATPQMEPGQVGTDACDTSGVFSQGTDTNSEPWVVGASAEISCVGTTKPQVLWLEGQIANLRFSKRPRDFGSMLLP